MAAIDLTVLGMIKAQPQSAYELQKNVEYRNISKWVKVSTPSIYKKVVQMEEKGYIRGKTVKEGKMPEKTVYQTQRQEKSFSEADGGDGPQPIRLFLDFNAVIMSLNLVSEQERRELTGRMEQEIEVMQKTVADKQAERTNVPLTGRSILEQQYLLFDALAKWMKGFREEYLEEEK